MINLRERHMYCYNMKEVEKYKKYKSNFQPIVYLAQENAIVFLNQ